MKNNKTVEFILKSEKIHGKKYDYSRVEYINNSTPVLIGYNGDFHLITPQNHLKGSKLESRKRKYNLEELIIELNNIHNNKYDYSKLNLNRLKDKSIIICPKHGEFKQAVVEHLNGHGCTKCGKESMSEKTRLTSEEITNRIYKKHSDKYKYLNLENVNSKTKLRIICPIHGEFEQKALYHMEYGCTKCGYSSFKNMGIENFINRSKEIHNNFYDYSKFIYTISSESSIIICPKHGEFKQTPNAHLRGSGCIKCGYEKNGIRLDTKYFFEQCREKHNNRYIYDENSFENTRNFITIYCPKHGEFKQKASSHLYSGCGCPSCSESSGETKIRLFLERNNIFFEQQKSFDGCLYKQKLLFDFYLPNKNLCIEFDGIQHFKPIEFFGGEESLNENKIKDDIKTKYCLENNIELIRISYKDKNNIEKILNNLLNE